MAFEIFVLAIVNELYFRRFDAAAALRRGPQAPGGQDRARCASSSRSRSGATPFEFFDFGVRRRFSGAWHREVAGARSSARCPSSSRAPPTCSSRATSAWCRSARWRTNTCRPSRRSACACATSRAPRSRTGCRSTAATSASALTDVVGMDAFLADFDLYFAKLFDGLRHDSGDPFVWGEKALAHYEKLRIDARTKRLVVLRRARPRDGRSRSTATSPIARRAASASAPTSPTTWA